jgi:hypothetical protein
MQLSVHSSGGSHPTASGLSTLLSSSTSTGITTTGEAQSKNKHSRPSDFDSHAQTSMLRYKSQLEKVTRNKAEAAHAQGKD